MFNVIGIAHTHQELVECRPSDTGPVGSGMSATQACRVVKNPPTRTHNTTLTNVADIYGNWIVLEDLGVDKNRNHTYRCVCASDQCLFEKTITGSDLRNGKTSGRQYCIRKHPKRIAPASAPETMPVKAEKKVNEFAGSPAVIAARDELYQILEPMLGVKKVEDFLKKVISQHLLAKGIGDSDTRPAITTWIWQSIQGRYGYRNGMNEMDVDEE